MILSTEHAKEKWLQRRIASKQNEIDASNKLIIYYYNKV